MLSNEALRELNNILDSLIKTGCKINSLYGNMSDTYKNMEDPMKKTTELIQGLFVEV
ncbi:MAG TPA: hypothetical protein PLQ20_02470 [Candidatus Paceibacterota bacterium]|nr:hypothetical protein [Candidatus Paceibacterota bacterium]